LEKHGRKNADEFLVGIEIWAGENHGKHQDPISATFLLASLRDHGTVQGQIKTGKPFQVRKVREEMKLVGWRARRWTFGRAKAAAGDWSGDSQVTSCIDLRRGSQQF